MHQHLVSRCIHICQDTPCQGIGGIGYRVLGVLMVLHIGCQGISGIGYRLLGYWRYYSQVARVLAVLLIGCQGIDGTLITVP